jgi:nucleoside-diphosphate-sugar epimerase
VLYAPRERIHNEVFNVGDTDENFQVKEIAEIVGETFPGCETSFGDSGGDNRSYRVSFDKIHEMLPGFSCEYSAERGARELYDLFKRIDMKPETFEDRPYTRLKQLKFLLSSKQLDDELYWL